MTEKEFRFLQVVYNYYKLYKIDAVCREIRFIVELIVT